MKLRFLWSGLITDVTTWVKFCAHCLSYNVRRNQKQALHFCWPGTIPFYTMHVDLCDPGKYLSNNSRGSHLLNAMCDLTQFVVSNITTETHGEHLPKSFMENVVLSFVMLQLLSSAPTVGSIASLKICAQPWGSSISLLHVVITNT